ncbi:phage tail sheath family protein [Pinirhizobacter soli]|uniref:phage tail sheath family protein n=1 Tax=Pinirhizobacter soli TaxID=2786953 RepID=UPI00202AA9E5|nr:phage tail sheath C-terminal domain-containing protein [Pinirhizobacter soli]
MPVTLSYPGVYVEEIPSGVHTITGVATSIAAFVGWAPTGPTDKAGLVLSFTDFVRSYGGIDARSKLGNAVNQFFLNGGSQAYIVRLAAADATAATVTLDGKIKLTAKSVGGWAADYAVLTKASSDGNTFRVTVLNMKTGASEVFDALSMTATDPRFAINVLTHQSAFVNAELVGTPTAPPADTVLKSDGTPPDTAKLAGGTDGATIFTETDATFITAMQPADQAGGVYLLDRVDLFNLLVVPGLSDGTALGALEAFCKARRAFLIADADSGLTFDTLKDGLPAGLASDAATNAAFYFPWLLVPDPLQMNRPTPFPPSGALAGIYARTDATRGVWKAPAGVDASITGAMGLVTVLTDGENGVLNPMAVNCLRNRPGYGTVVWGARTLRGADATPDDWKYIPVRRTALFIEESLFRGTQWVVFEPNDEPLWSQIRLNVGAFMHDLFRQGAFQGTTPQDAYFVKCDKETTTQSDINNGIVNILVGFAPLKPAEFVVIQLQQMAGQIQT